ncbi:MAG TPA: cell division protein FtsA, partial [Paracoccus sp. (in: a-proteobacteria)]|nr:cell division protein FtsA [Paracoccus sp. (in: a-proteobacteria)]
MRDLCQGQRAMRNMRRQAMQRGVIAVLDIGTSKIACLVLQFDGPGQFRETDGVGPMAGQSNFRVIGTAHTRSRGMRYGEIETMAETERAIRTVIQSAQKVAGVRVDHVIACISGARPASYGLAGEIGLSSGKVSEQCVARVLGSCDVPDFGRGREVLHAQPVN